jgi:DNA-binding Lrp family transcriptional regulator
MPNSRQHPDYMDQQILALLGEDAREKATIIAKKLELAPATVRRRIKQLEDEGIIVKYTVILDHAKVSDAIEAYLLLHFTEDADVTGFLREQVTREEIREGSMITGSLDAIMRVRMPDRAHLLALVKELRDHPEIKKCATQVALERVRYVATPADV